MNLNFYLFCFYVGVIDVILNYESKFFLWLSAYHYSFSFLKCRWNALFEMLLLFWNAGPVELNAYHFSFLFLTMMLFSFPSFVFSFFMCLDTRKQWKNIKKKVIMAKMLMKMKLRKLSVITRRVLDIWDGGNVIVIVSVLINQSD